MEDAIPQGKPGGLQSGHETSEIRTRTLLISGAVLVATVVVCQVGLGLWMREFNRKEERTEALFPNRQALEVDQFPRPRLQESPPVDLVSILREERARVSSYGWVDQKAGIARIPVDRAMEIIEKEGLPKVAAQPVTPGAPANTTIPPARKREEAGPEEDQPKGKAPAGAEQEKPSGKAEQQPRTDTQRGGKP